MRIGEEFLDIYSSPKVINNGFVINTNGENVPYILELGLNKSSILECNGWKDFIIKILWQHGINAASIQKNKEILQEYMMLGDFHWNWVKKALFYNTSEYNWFFLKTSDGVQGTCVTYHPKKSVFQRVNIFYIHYIACAPWNRESPLHIRKFKGIGTEILKQVQYFFLKNHHYTHGFNLHSLQQSQGFYEFIGMKSIPEYDNENGFFYEMSKENAILFLEGKNA